MAINVKNPGDMKKLIKVDIDKLMDQTLWLAMDYSEGFLANIYNGECMAFWPLTVEGEPVKDPVTGEEFSDNEAPDEVIKHIQVDFATVSEHMKSGMIWVNVEGKPELEKLERAARMQEVFGCRPWGKLKSNLRENFSEIVKQHANSIKNKFGLK